MKIYECEQGSAEWSMLRLGKPTASSFGKIVTPTGKLSAQAADYAHVLIAEELLQRPMESLEGLPWIEHGREYEAEAAKVYEFENSVTTKKVGFITNDAGDIGASPDRLVGENGLLEIKCPAPQTMVRYMLGEGIDPKYKPQIQGQLWLAQREWCDWFAYSREMPPVRVRAVRDEDYIATMAAALREFCAMKAKMLERIKATGFFDTLIQNPQARELPTANIFQ